MERWQPTREQLIQQQEYNRQLLQWDLQQRQKLLYQQNKFGCKSGERRVSFSPDTSFKTSSPSPASKSRSRHSRSRDLPPHSDARQDEEKRIAAVEPVITTPPPPAERGSEPETIPAVIAKALKSVDAEVRRLTSCRRQTPEFTGTFIFETNSQLWKPIFFWKPIQNLQTI